MTIKTIKAATDIVGSLSKPSKMPTYSYGIGARHCIVGQILAKRNGSTCSDCYALKGSYRMYKNVAAAENKRFASLVNPKWVAAMSFLINKRCADIGYFRWHDSGDLQSVSHLRKIAAVCDNTPTVQHWLPTRETRILSDYAAQFGALPGNLTVRVSATMMDQKPGTAHSNTSTVHKDTSPHGTACIAPQQDGECRDCRACWDKTVSNVSYAQH